MMKVKELFYYPLKSGKAIQVDRLEIGQTGPLYDRNWLVMRFPIGLIILIAATSMEIVVPDESGNLSLAALSQKH